ncbi:hypothetical protein LG651_15315 [Tamlana sp. 62-3]|uniref:Uncharacterized protein n=1 Tax=Neotamlana sargassicola TaxID=2883125 RepID=A0A9X1IA91_9FLAO|nr:hypothetical protein [Tamlana sargassicola]MCB4809624.1 hypothetical protein [Tamlana sargassicola]
MKENLKKRMKVLEYSLTLEFVASCSLGYLLDIDILDLDKSKSLGNSSSALSFSQKINLLLDNKSISKDDKLKLEAFMNVRNQFIHNKKANSYTKAFGMISGLINRMKKTFPDNFIDSELENSLEICVKNLYSDSLDVLTDFKGGREKKMTIQVQRDVYMKRYKIFQRVTKQKIDEFYKYLNDFKSKKIDKEEILPKLDLLKYEIILQTNIDYEKEE